MLSKIKKAPARADRNDGVDRDGRANRADRADRARADRDDTVLFRCFVATKPTVLRFLKSPDKTTRRQNCPRSFF